MTEFDSYSDDGVSAFINVHTEAHLFSLPNDCLWYDKLWGPSQRVVTLLILTCHTEYSQMEIWNTNSVVF